MAYVGIWDYGLWVFVILSAVYGVWIGVNTCMYLDLER